MFTVYPFPEGEFIRFKIYGLCSVSILKGFPEPVFAVHFKKKEVSPSLGRGLSSKVTKALFYNREEFALKAEKTTYQFYFPPKFKRDLPIDDGSFFINDPELSYPYVSFIKRDGFTFLTSKWCQFLDLYEISLCEYLDLNRSHRFLKAPTFFQIALFISQSLKALHDKDWIHRDLKPDNILIKLNTFGREIDLNEISLVATDLETLTQQDDEATMWVGTPDYHPINKSSQRQDKSSDIFALGKSLKFLFSDFLSSHERLGVFIERMQSEIPLTRPNIDEVISILKEHQSPYVS